MGETKSCLRDQTEVTIEQCEKCVEWNPGCGCTWENKDAPACVDVDLVLEVVEFPADQWDSVVADHEARYGAAMAKLPYSRKTIWIPDLDKQREAWEANGRPSEWKLFYLSVNLKGKEGVSGGDRSEGNNRTE